MRVIQISTLAVTAKSHATRLLLCALLATLVGASGCDKQEGSNDATPSPPSPWGISFSPRGFPSSMSSQDVLDFFEMARHYGSVVAFHMPWRDSLAISGEIPQTVRFATTMAQRHGFRLALGLGWSSAQSSDLGSPSEPGNDSWTNTQTRQQFLSMVTALANAYRPPFLFLGNEIDLWEEAAGTGEWDAWVSEYDACYDAIKAVSPETVVFVTFQLEHLEGLGAKNGWSAPPRWDLLADLADKLDAVGFTSYPYFEYESPADIPNDVYTRVRSWWPGPVIFTEIGWTADPAAPYTGSEAEQSAFVDRFATLTDSLQVMYSSWAFLHDPTQSLGPAFSQVGLRAADGTPRPADAIWRALVKVP